MKLLALGLDGQPAHDVTGATISVWVEAICTDRVWVERRDVARFRKAFRVLMTTCDRWPTPRRFLEALPSSVSPFRAHLRLEHDSAREARVQSFTEISEKLGIPLPDKATGPDAA